MAVSLPTTPRTTSSPTTTATTTAAAAADSCHRSGSSTAMGNTAIPPSSPSVLVIAHIRELSSAKPSPTRFTTSTRQMTWHSIPQETAAVWGMPSSENLVALWQAQSEGSPLPTSSLTTPLVHIPQCRLEITSFPDLLAQGGGPAGKIERVALPGQVFRNLLSQTSLPDGAARAPRHFDDDDDWVFSRCVLGEFSGLGEQEAARMSEEGRLCCWASLVAMRDADHTAWDVGVVVHRVFARWLPSGPTGCSCRCD